MFYFYCNDFREGVSGNRYYHIQRLYIVIQSSNTSKHLLLCKDKASDLMYLELMQTELGFISKMIKLNTTIWQKEEKTDYSCPPRLSGPLPR